MKVQRENGHGSSLHHPFRARFYTGLFLFILAFIGLVITDVHHNGGFSYWRYVVPLFAISGLFLSWYLRHKNQSHSVAFIWHELLHWAGLLLAVYLVSELLRVGLLSRFAASLVILTMLALALFLAGIYIELTFLVLGLVIGGFVVVIAFLTEYLYVVSIPLVIIGIALLFFLARKKKKHAEIDE